MKHAIVMIAAMSLAYNVQAQSVEDGIKMYNYEKYQTAKKILEPLAAANPMANYYWGLAELQMGYKETAKLIFQKYPLHNANISGVARVNFAMGNATEGMKIANDLASKAKKKEWEPLKYAADAITYTEGGDVQQAVTWYKAALAVYDNNDIRLSLGDASQKLSGGGGDAMNAYDKVIANDPKNSLAYSREGKLWYAARRYDLALENWKKAQEADPENPLPYRDLADAYSYTGKYDMAKKNADRYMELCDKTNADYERYLYILFQSKDFKGSRDLALDLLNKGIGKISFYGILAFSQYELGDTTMALKNAVIYFSKQDPAKVFPNDYRTYAKIWLANSQVDSADMYFQKAVDKDSSNTKIDGYRDNADVLREKHWWLKSANWYSRLINDFPDKAKATDYFYNGFTLYYGHSYDGATNAFSAMRNKFPDQPSAIYWQGRTAAAIDSDVNNGLAKQYYTDWLNINVAGYERKPNDLTQAYRYLMVLGYNTGDKESLDKYRELLRGINPADPVLKQIDDAVKSGATPKKPAAKPTTKPAAKPKTK
ncbi:MAG: hypothetical protein JST82_07940 [Bacteroidetes bacterium]|nr:hypothetical protein [Bacteroidota bacterium]